MRLIDSHCHIDSREYDADRPDVIARARAAGLEHIVLVGLWRQDEGVASAARAVSLAAKDPSFASPTACIHPHDVAQAPPADFEAIEALCALPAVVGVGETGLDYHYDHSPREAQRAAFAAQIELANRHHLALVVHTREAWDDTLDILSATGIPERTVIHCFTGGPVEARRCLDLGAHLSFSGVVTFKTAGEVREAAELCPMDRLLVETDSPFLAPVPHRGSVNEPARVPVVGAAIAHAKGVTAEQVALASTRSTISLFSL